MDFLIYLKLAQAVIKELWKFRYPALLLGFVLGLCGVVIGMSWQEKFETRSTLYADYSNIISPLLKGQAQTTGVDNQTQVVRDILLSQDALEKVVNEQGFLVGGESATQIASAISSLRDAVTVSRLGENYIEVSYTDVIPARSFAVVQTLVSMFVEESSENKRSESRQAYLFIDKQVETYKEQLQAAENKLKEFNASNLDGTEAQALTNIEYLRRDIEKLELDYEQSVERVQSLEQQVEQEDRFLSEKARADVFNERIAQAVKELDELRLFYTDSHPDVIAMQEHIRALQKAKVSDAPVAIDSSNGDIQNPVYDQLRAALASARVEQNSLQKRLNSLSLRLEEGRARLQRLVARNAELSELTRDYDVTRGLYEDLLQRKEQARLSMTLDIEGQGVTYRVQEPPQFPLVPSGLTFAHFVLLGILAGLAAPIALSVVYVFLDPRIRFASVVQQEFDVPLLGEIPHLSSSLTVRLHRSDVRVFLFWFLLLACVYVGFVIGYVFLFA